MTSLIGGCACGAVPYSASSNPGFSFHCQCRQCQRSTGTGPSKIVSAEKVAISMDTTGHAGAPIGGDTDAITAPWVFLGNTGSDYLTVAVTGDTVSA